MKICNWLLEAMQNLNQKLEREEHKKIIQQTTFQHPISVCLGGAH
jgi:hypothetical protein